LAVIISLGAGASNAFAGWSPKPTKAVPGQLAAASAACQRSQSSVAGDPLAIADTRGPFTFAVYANSESTISCIQGPSFVLLSQSKTSSPVNVPADRVLISSLRRSARGGHAFGFTYGRTGTSVSAVTLVLDDGTKVQATVANGWFVAWWPSGAQLKAAELTTPSGVSTQTFNLPQGCNTNKDCPGGNSVVHESGAGQGGFGMDGVGKGGGKQSGVSFSQ
ncbi:MAG TPA: hypothetical protein VJ741_23705, partial [Solirubrobacteraceae bacterium]|nr:hypothetical protein [Solirubrobacteraceae bacterium]